MLSLDGVGAFSLRSLLEFEAPGVQHAEVSTGCSLQPRCCTHQSRYGPTGSTNPRIAEHT